MQYVCPILDRATQTTETGFRRDSWSLVQCLETGLVFLANPPEYAELETSFAWEQTWKTEAERRQAEEPVVSRLSSYAKKAKSILAPGRNKIASLVCTAAYDHKNWEPLRLLDVGCGSGNLMVEIHDRLGAKGRKLIPCGIEVSKALAIESRERIAPIGGQVVFANAINGTTQLERNSIHIAVLSSFLEHESRPLDLLRQLRRILAPSGVVVLKVPNFACWNRSLRGRKWCGFRFPDHVNYFTPSTLQRLAEEAGFTISRQTFWDRFPLSDNMYAVLEAKRTEQT